MSSKYDIETNFTAWTALDQTIDWPNPNAAWYKLTVPKRIRLQLYSKQTESSILYAWYNESHGRIAVYGSEIAIDQ